MYYYGYNRSLSSVPSHLTAPNGLNFVRSVNNPNSRLNKVRNYLAMHGASTKREIVYSVFGKKIMDKRIPWYNNNSGEVTSGWGSYLFNYAQKHGYIKSKRVGNQVFYSLP